MVSVIIPVYNGEAYIKRCLDSIFADKECLTDIEVIAVNDGSRDGSSELLHDYAKSHPQLRVIDQENGGLSKVRERGISEARGEFIAFVDVDDWVEPDIFIRMRDKAKESGADIVFCDYIEEFPTYQNHLKSKFDKNQTFPLTVIETFSYIHRRQAVFQFAWNKLYRTEVFKGVQFPDTNIIGEDYNLMLQALDNAHSIDYVQMFGNHYVITPNSMSRGGFSPTSVRSYNYYKQEYFSLCKKYPEIKKEITNYHIVEYLAMIIAMGRNNTYDKSMIKEIKKFVRKGYWGFLFASYVSIKMKGSATAFLFNYKFLTFIYRIISK